MGAAGLLDAAALLDADALEDAGSSCSVRRAAHADELRLRNEFRFCPKLLGEVSGRIGTA
eukprot:9714639-Alexandrium_andersonii.AAC.1